MATEIGPLCTTAAMVLHPPAPRHRNIAQRAMEQGCVAKTRETKASVEQRRPLWLKMHVQHAFLLVQNFCQTCISTMVAAVVLWPRWLNLPIAAVHDNQLRP